MSDDKIAVLRSNLVEKGLLGEFEDHVEIDRQGKIIPISERTQKEEEEKEEELAKTTQYIPQKNTDILQDSCTVS